MARFIIDGLLPFDDFRYEVYRLRDSMEDGVKDITSFTINAIIEMEEDFDNTCVCMSDHQISIYHMKSPYDHFPYSTEPGTRTGGRVTLVDNEKINTLQEITSIPLVHGKTYHFYCFIKDRSEILIDHEFYGKLVTRYTL